MVNITRDEIIKNLNCEILDKVYLERIIEVMSQINTEEEIRDPNSLLEIVAEKISDDERTVRRRLSRIKNTMGPNMLAKLFGTHKLNNREFLYRLLSIKKE